MNKVLAVIASLGLMVGIAMPAFADYAPPNNDSSVATLPNGQQSVSGLTNVLSLACGIPINDGNTHTVGTAPAGSCFNGKTTLAQLAAININGTTPFSFLTASGATVGPLCTLGSTTNCFTNGAYTLTDSKVANLDIGWLAIQAALMTRHAYLPAGAYKVGTTYALPLMIPIASEADINNWSTGIRFEGDGAKSSVIFSGHSYGFLADGTTVIPTVSCGDPAGTSANNLGRYNGNDGQCSGLMSDIGLWGDTPDTSIATPTFITDGLAWGARLKIDDVNITGFYHGISIVGDHTLFKRLNISGGYIGAYWAAPNSILVGDLAFHDLGVSGMWFAALDVDGAAAIVATFNGETYLNAQNYAINGDANGCAPIIAGATIDHLMTEFLGLGVINDAHNFNTTTHAYTDSNKCRDVRNLDINYWFSQFDNSKVPSGSTRRRRAAFDIAGLSGTIRGYNTQGGTIIPTADPTGDAGVAIFNVSALGDTGTGQGFHFNGSLNYLFTLASTATASGGPIPIINPSADVFSTPAFSSWDNTGGNGGRFMKWFTSGNVTALHVGDLLENQLNNFGGVVDAGTSVDQPVVGVAQMPSSVNGSVVPVAQYGVTAVSTGWFFGYGALMRKSTGVGGYTTITPGSGGTNNTYTITATGGGCTTEPIYSVTVAGGAITGASVTNGTTQTGCTSAPSVSTASITGLTGGSIVPQWPSGDAAQASGASDVNQIGYGMNNSGGSTTTGTATNQIMLKNIQ